MPARHQRCCPCLLGQQTPQGNRLLSSNPSFCWKRRQRKALHTVQPRAQISLCCKQIKVLACQARSRTALPVFHTTKVCLVSSLARHLPCHPSQKTGRGGGLTKYCCTMGWPSMRVCMEAATGGLLRMSPSGWGCRSTTNTCNKQPCSSLSGNKEAEEDSGGGWGGGGAGWGGGHNKFTHML